MKDLTQGSIPKHLVELTTFIAMSMVFQMLYFLADLYWVSRLGREAVAAVSFCGNLMLAVLAITQTLGVGTTTLVSHAVGQKDNPRAQRVFNQAFVLSLLTGIVVGVLGFLLRDLYCQKLAADPATEDLGRRFLTWFIPALTLQFIVVALGSALRAAGVVKPTVAIQVATVVLNMVLAPVLIFGWISHRPMGVAGASMATLVANIVGVAIFLLYFIKAVDYLRFAPADWPPDMKIWSGMVKVGLPAGGEFALLSVYMVLVYWVIRSFGSAAQAGFGIGGRLMQLLFFPVMALSFSVAPLVGQNFGARNGGRVRDTARTAILIAVGLMTLCTLICQLAPYWLISLFSKDPAVLSFGVEYLRIISWNFIASGIIFTSSSVFQGIGNTIPPLASSSARLLLFALPVYLLSLQPGFQIRTVWFISVGSVTLQMCLNLFLLRRELGRKLAFAAAPEVAVPAPA